MTSDSFFNICKLCNLTCDFCYVNDLNYKTERSYLALMFSKPNLVFLCLNLTNLRPFENINSSQAVYSGGQTRHFTLRIIANLTAEPPSCKTDIWVVVWSWRPSCLFDEVRMKMCCNNKTMFRPPGPKHGKSGEKTKMDNYILNCHKQIYAMVYRITSVSCLKCFKLLACSQTPWASSPTRLHCSDVCVLPELYSSENNAILNW